MIQGEHSGFTIIEVILFLAISALLLLIAFSFTGATLRNTRFTDSTKSLQSFFQEQYTRVQTNSLALNTPANTRPVCAGSGDISSSSGTNSTGTSQSCVLLGAALDLNGTSIEVSPVLGWSGADTLSKANPRIWASGKETYSLAWQANITTAKSVLANNVKNKIVPYTADVDRLLFLRDVASEAISFYATKNTTELASIVNGTELPSNTRNVPTLVCITSSDAGLSMRGAVQIKGTGTETSTSINAMSSSVVTTSDVLFKNIVSGFDEGVRCV